MGKPTKTATSRWIKNKADEHAADNGHYFDEAAAQRVVKFFEQYLRHTKGEWMGKHFLLTAERKNLPDNVMKYMGKISTWQKDMIMQLFGWKRRDGSRRFREAYKQIARKNGKSETCAGEAAYGAFGDMEPSADVYCAATDRDQAAIVYEACKSMVQTSPELNRYAKCFRRTISIDRTKSSIKVLSADAPSKHGFNSHFNIIDELHAHKSRELYDILKTGTSARRQPLTIVITTAGYDQQLICYEKYTYAKKVLNNAIYDDAFYVLIFEPDEGDDWSDPITWAKANPNLGVCKKFEYMRDGFNAAKDTPAAENTYRRLELNQWTQQFSRWINLDIWDEQAGEPINEDELIGREFYGGLDLSSVSDITAWILLFPKDDDPDAVDILCRFWCPESRLYAQNNQYKEQYQEWKRQGYLRVTPGNAIDKEFVKAQILKDCNKFNLQSMNVDALFQGYDLAMALSNELGEQRVLGMRQGFISYAAPMKTFEERFLKRKLHHGGHPVLRWMADNVAVQQDAAGNLKPDKSNSQGKIDGIPAMVMALDRAGRHKSTTSVYEDRGILVI